jgi:hypothetical protein
MGKSIQIKRVHGASPCRCTRRKADSRCGYQGALLVEGVPCTDPNGRVWPTRGGAFKALAAFVIELESGQP